MTLDDARWYASLVLVVLWAFERIENGRLKRRCRALNEALHASLEAFRVTRGAEEETEGEHG